MRKIARAQTEDLVRDAEVRGHVVGARFALTDEEDGEPWAAAPSRRRKDNPIQGVLPEKLQLVLGNDIYLAKESLPAALRNRLIRLAAFQNQEFYRAQAMRLPTLKRTASLSRTTVRNGIAEPTR